MSDKSWSRHPLKALLEKIIYRARAEPVAVHGLIQTGLAVALGFGLITWTTEQVGLVLTFSAAVLTFLTRQQVTPTFKVTGSQPPDLTLSGAGSHGPHPAPARAADHG